MSTRSIEEINSLLEGPISSIFTPFTREGEVDWDGVRAMTERGIAGGSRVTMLTYGNTQIEFLTDDELAKMTRIVIEQSKGRSLVVAGNRPWSTCLLYTSDAADE